MAQSTGISKEQHRRAKELHRLRKQQQPVVESTKVGAPIDCACVIHGNLYSWDYVDRLYAMIVRNFSCPVNFHVFTEQDRLVPSYMIKHVLTEWPGVAGKKKAWWYKMQLFNPNEIKGQLLYFDLDTVITESLDWIRKLEKQYFWAVRDFRYLFRPNYQGLNSSIMYWDTVRFAPIWENFKQRDITSVIGCYPGDQDYLTDMLDRKDIRFIPEAFVKSWRWQVHDGGMDFKTKTYFRPDAGGIMAPGTKVLVFHGHPKPHEVNDPVVSRFWTMDTD